MDNKNIINLDQCVKVVLEDMCHNREFVWYETEFKKNIFGKIKKVYDEGFYSYWDTFNDRLYTNEKILNTGKYFINDNKVYYKPELILHHSNGDKTHIYYDTYEEALKKYNYCLEHIKNKIEY